MPVSIYTLLLGLATFLKPTLCEFTYTAVSPIALKPHSTYDILTTLEKYDSPVKFKFIITSEKNETVSTQEITLPIEDVENTTAALDIGDLFDDFYNLTVKATELGTGNQVVEEYIRLQRDLKNTSILIETDKPIYKPGEIVRFRILMLNRFFQPVGVNIPVDIKITDPEANIIKVKRSVTIPGDRGYIASKVELSPEPNLGNWMISVVRSDNAAAGNDRGESYTFSVDQYVLPKYKVDMKFTPTFITYNDSKSTVEVSSIYSYGKPVKGRCSLEFKQPYYYYYGERESKVVSKTVDLDAGTGRAAVEFDFKKELSIPEDAVAGYGREFIVSASCVDQVSGQVKNESRTIKMYKYPYRIELVQTPEQIKPGFPFNVTVKVSTRDDVPLGDAREDALTIRHGFAFNAEDGIIKTSIPPNGLVQVTFMAPSNPKICYDPLEITFKDVTENLYLPRKVVSSTGSYMQLTLQTGNKLKEGDEFGVFVKSSKPFISLNVVLLARGIVLSTQRIPNPDKTLQKELKIKLVKNSSPKAKLLIYAILAPNLEVIADSIPLDVSPDRKNALDISLSQQTVEPGSNLSISFVSLPNSIIAIKAVDQSVLLLKNDNGINQEKLSEAARDFDDLGFGHNYWGGSDTYQMFIKAGLNILTNGRIEKAPSRFEPVSFSLSGAAAPMPQALEFDSTPNEAAYVFMSNEKTVSSSRGEPPRVRSKFPETWIWEELEGSPSGQITIQKVVPDTITSWVINGYQINPEYGIGLQSGDTKLTVFRPFFIFLNLPYSIVKGEVLGLQVMVHNYMEEPVNATVTLENKEGFFKFIEQENSQGDQMSKEVLVEPSSIASVTFPISPEKFGTMNLNVQAITPAAGDAVSRTLIVKPPGVKQVQNSAILMNLPGEKSAIYTVSAIFPEPRVPLADSLKVSVVGDILGAAMTNLDNLIRLPCGCGEQNMLNFVPNIVILDYLKATGGLTKELKRKAVRFLEKGYQQELTYMRHDGSFSAFGKSDLAGSTWLTAFVTRSFISAKKYITIDDEVILKSLKYLIEMQNDNGSFAEQGRVFDKELQGGATNEFSLTAYTLLTFVEARRSGIYLKNLSTDHVIDKGVQLLVNETTTPKLANDPYAVNLITYLIHLIDHRDKNYFFMMTERLAKINDKDSTKHWEPLKSSRQTLQQVSKPFYQPWISNTKPASVEMTAYALLTYLLHGEDKISDAVPIARWLMKQRNAQGGFLSTQDTVLGITALAKFAEGIHSQESEWQTSVKVSWKNNDTNSDNNSNASDEGPSTSYTFYIGKDNKTTLQEYILPLSVREVELEASGKGTALAQLTWTYYVEAKDNTPAFNLAVTVKDRDKGRNIDLTICSSYSKGGPGGASNMAIVEAFAPSGYAFDQEELEKLRRMDNLRRFARFETEDRDSKVIMYFNSLDINPYCLTLNAFRVYLVAKHAKGSVIVYDYYDTTRRGQQFYDVPNISMCDLCAVDNSCEIQNCA